MSWELFPKLIDSTTGMSLWPTELDDILKLTYSEELSKKDTRPLMRKYASIQNRVHVDYKKLRESILEQVN